MAEELRAMKQRRYDMRRACSFVSVCGEEGKQSVVCFDAVLAIKPFQVKKFVHFKAKY